MESVYSFIKKCETYYLATCEGDQARVRPFGTIDLYDGKLYIQTGKAKDVSKQLHLNGKCELCCFDGSTWLRVCGTLVEDDNVLARKHMLDAYPMLRNMYYENDGNTEVFYFASGVATFSSFTEAPKVVEW